MTLPTEPETQAPAGPQSGHDELHARNGLATTSLYLGFLSIPASLVAFPAAPLPEPWFAPGIIMAGVAVLFGGLALRRARREGVTKKVAAVTGLVIGIISVAFAAYLLYLDIRVTSECQDKVGPGKAYFGYEQCIEAQIF